MPCCFCWKKNGVFKASALAIFPSVVFLFSGIMSRSILLTVAALLLAPAHIRISYQNAKNIRERCLLEKSLQSTGLWLYWKP